LKTAEPSVEPGRLIERVRSSFHHSFSGPAHVALAPGRVNLVGEHTDYNDGFVLPMAINRYMSVAFGSRSDRQLHVFALDLDESRVLNLNSLDSVPHGHWSRYVAGVAKVLQDEGHALRGANLVLHGNIPVGAGLSSSAALELAVLRALASLADVTWDSIRMAGLARTAENEFVGVACGIMDQFVVAVPTDGAALLLDCQTLTYEQVHIPEDTVIYVLDTGVPRELSNSVYDARVQECREVVRIVQKEDRRVRALRDISPEMLEHFRPSLPPLLYRRAKHVVEETLRPRQMAEALRVNDLVSAGQIMLDSHRSLRDLYEVSSPELDYMVETAFAHDACYGARLTGAGLGGCAIALVDRADHRDFAAWISRTYRARFDYRSAFYACRPATGARLL
jgi:galactokinase